MIVVRTYDTAVSEYYFDDAIGEDEAKRIVIEGGLSPSDEWVDFDIDVYRDDS
jgi:hypothetical protein